MYSNTNIPYEIHPTINTKQIRYLTFFFSFIQSDTQVRRLHLKYYKSITTVTVRTFISIYINYKQSSAPCFSHVFTNIQLCTNNY